MVSIVCPVYDTAAYLDEAIQSVIAQTFQNWELLLVDDGSTDTSPEICQRYAAADDRIRYIHKDNGGQASARNLGIKNAKFDWIAFIDSDDFWAPEKLEVQLKELQEHQPDFLYSSGFEYHDGRLVAYDWHFAKWSGADFARILYRSCMVNCNTVMVSKRMLLDCGLFDEDQRLRGVDDWDLWLRIARKSTVVFGSEKRMAYYRIHSGCMHHQLARMQIGRLLVYLKYEENCPFPRLVQKRQLRDTYRVLLNHLYAEHRFDDVRRYMVDFYRHDRLNPFTLTQRLLSAVLPLESFMWISNKVIYRISHRLESLIYLVGIPKQYRS